MNEKKSKKTLGYYVGYVMAASVAICIGACSVASISALTYKFITWIWGLVI